MRVIVIDAVKRAAEHQILAGEQGLLDFFPNGLSFCGHLPTGDAVYIDDDALLNPATDFVLVPCYPMPLPMKALICGPDSEDGESTLDVRSTLDEIRASVQWTGRPVFEAWAKARGDTAALAVGDVTIVTWNEIAAKSRPESVQT